jgi:ATP-binding protein involved in chromosome partitioning
MQGLSVNYLDQHTTGTHVIGVVAGKGGVGKSTITVDLALALSEKGYRVGIIDADVYGPSIRKMLPEARLPEQHPEWHERLIPAVSIFGIKVISMAFFRKEDEPAIIRAPIANAVIKQFLEQVDWGQLDYLLIDFPPGTGDIQLTLLQQATLSGAIVVTTPQEVATLDVCKAMQMLQQMRVPILGVIENMSYFQTSLGGECFYPFGKEGGKRLAEKFGTPFLCEIPLDPCLCACADQGKSIFKEYPQSVSAQVFAEASAKIVHQLGFLQKMEGICLKNFELIWQSAPDGR